jgi:hypothetical protein
MKHVAVERFAERLCTRKRSKKRHMRGVKILAAALVRSRASRTARTRDPVNKSLDVCDGPTTSYPSSNVLSTIARPWTPPAYSRIRNRCSTCPHLLPESCPVGPLKLTDWADQDSRRRYAAFRAPPAVNGARLLRLLGLQKG